MNGFHLNSKPPLPLSVIKQFKLKRVEHQLHIPTYELLGLSPQVRIAAILNWLSILQHIYLSIIYQLFLKWSCAYDLTNDKYFQCQVLPSALWLSSFNPYCCNLTMMLNRRLLETRRMGKPSI